MKYLIIGLVFLAGYTLQAQKKYDQLSLELKYGAITPISPNNFIERSEYISFENIQVGMRYMFSQKFGISGGYAFQSFGGENNGLNSQRFSLEGVVSLTQIFSVPYYLKERVNLQLHAGPGVSIVNPTSIRGYETVGNLLMGGTLLVRVSSAVAIVGDLTYNYHLSQSYAYNGQPLDIKRQAENGSSVFVGIGINVYLGEEKHHADWY